jgi:23S rRNA (cytidine1920-2'-O)/16S rRNA (cytidine1409-2'-O)-methyltransferase
MAERNNPEKLRLDQLLVERGLAESREKAQRLLLAGEVYLGETRAPKAGTKVPRDADLRVKGGEKFVGRGGLKLEAALEHFQVPVQDRTCLDVGASTGGFTDCLLQRGARRVYAYDVGHGQLHWRIRQDPRVVVGEGINVRHLQPADLPEPVDLAVADVSFISLTLILPPVFALMEPVATMIVLVKPQFELDRAAVERGGIVRDPALQESAVEKIRRFATEVMGLHWRGVISSPILGTKGNREFLACLQRP